MEHESVTHTTVDYTLCRRPSGSDVAATVHRYVGGAGPTVHVHAGQHGIELNGPVALRHLHDELTTAAIAGTVVTVPLSNPLAFDHRSYTAPVEYDARHPNLNRVWPGDDEGSLQERMAASLWELVADADAVVDLHTGTPDMLEHVRFREGDPEARLLAETFGTEYLLADPDDGSDQGKLRTAAASAGIPAITAELSNSRQVSRAAVEAGLDGVRNVLRELDVLDVDADSDRRPDQSLLRDGADATFAGDSGLFELRTDVAVGDHLVAGDEIGAIYCPSSFERRRTVTAADTGVAYSLTREPIVAAGDRLAAVAPPA
jgi:predicted deacylase